MNVAEYISLLEDPSQVSSSQTRGLEAILEQYPYFQSARAMQLKGLKDAKSFAYNKELKLTAAYTVDRSLLFEFITSKEFSQNTIANSLKSRNNYLKSITVYEPQEVLAQKSLSIDDAIKMNLKDAQQVFDENLFETPKPTLNKKQDQTTEKQTQTTTTRNLQIGQPFEFDKTEFHSFSTWLQLTTLTPIERQLKLDPLQKDAKETKDTIEKEKKLKLIDNFIAANPKIQPVKTISTSPKTAVLQSSKLPEESLMTATLARVYLEQKNYKKAIQAYKILILKYPEKSSFFADQIREIETLIEKQ